MQNWKTTLAGTLAAAFGYLATQFPPYAPVLNLLSSMAMAALGYHASDKGSPQ